MFDYDSLFGSFSSQNDSKEEDLAASFYQQQSDDSRPVGVSTTTDDSNESTGDASTPAISHDQVLADLVDESKSEDEDVIESRPGTQDPMQSGVDVPNS